MMKKLLALLLALMLPCCALGEGIGALLDDMDEGGSLDDLIVQEENPYDGVAPDPEDLLGKGKVLRQDFKRGADYVCTAYIYPAPRDAAAFADAYAVLARQNGFTVQAETIDGYPGYVFSHPDGDVMLVPDFSGSVLLMVENGLPFGEPIPEGEYLQVTYNGRLLEDREPWSGEDKRSYYSKKNDYRSYNSFYILSRFERATMSLLSIYIPNYVQEGDAFEVDKDHLVEGLNVTYVPADTVSSVDLLCDLEFNALEKGDFFRLKVERIFEMNGEQYLEATFSGSFYQGKVLFENGRYCMKIPDMD